MSTIKIESINVRGIRDKLKRTDIIKKAIEENVNILCLQETHITEEDFRILKEEFNLNYVISGKERNAGGVMIIIDNNFEYKIHNRIISQDSRYIILDIELPAIARFLLVNIYAPNDDTPKYFENLFQNIEKMDIKNIIAVGDWNLVNDFDKDTYNYRKQNNIKASMMVDSIKNKLDLVDIWRQTHPGENKYTWRQLFYKKMARLDFFLISETLLDMYGDSHIKNSYKSDHSPVNLILNTSKHKKGKGNWKINNSLLLDLKLKEKIEKEIELVVCIYACTPYSQDYVIQNYKEVYIELMIDIELMWEVLQAQLRDIIMKYAANKKRKQKQRE